MHRHTWYIIYTSVGASGKGVGTEDEKKRDSLIIFFPFDHHQRVWTKKRTLFCLCFFLFFFVFLVCLFSTTTNAIWSSLSTLYIYIYIFIYRANHERWVYGTELSRRDLLPQKKTPFPLCAAAPPGFLFGEKNGSENHPKRGDECVL